MDERPPESPETPPASPTPPPAQPDPRREALETLGGGLAGLLIGIVGAFAELATSGSQTALAVLTVVFLLCIVFGIQQARRRETTPFMRAFYVGASIALLLCSACSGMMVFSSGRIAG